MSLEAVTRQHPQAVRTTEAPTGLLQRRCDCGQHTYGGTCKGCGGLTSDRAGDRQTAGETGHAAKSRPKDSAPRSGGSSARTPSMPIMGRTRDLVIQTKLKAGRAGDRFEREADRIADAVVNTPVRSGPAFQSLSTGSRTPEGTTVQRQETGVVVPEEVTIPPGFTAEEWLAFEVPEPAEDADETTVATHSSGSAERGLSPGLDAEIQSVRGGGRPLAPSTRAFFEPRFRRDFSEVRVHTDARAAATAEALGADAYAVGRDIVFGPAQFRPGTTSGDRLIAHELTHVVQQTQAPSDTTARTRPVQGRTNGPVVQGGWTKSAEEVREGGLSGTTSGNGRASRAQTAGGKGVSVGSRAFQTKPRLQWCVDGGTATISSWLSRQYTFVHDGRDNNFLDITVAGALSGAAKSEDLHYAEAGAAVVGLTKTRTPTSVTPPETQMFLLSEGGRSSAISKRVTEIDVTIPINGTVRSKIPLDVVSEGSLASFAKNNSPGATHDVSGSVGSETFVEVYLGVRVEATADVESTCALFEGVFDDVNWSRAQADFDILWRDRRAPGTVTPSTPTEEEGAGTQAVPASGHSVTPTDLHAFGSSTQPRDPRRGQDLDPDDEDYVGPTDPPEGASTFADVNEAPLTGHFHTLSGGTSLGSSLRVIADGADVGGPHPRTHHTIFPAVRMLFDTFVSLFQRLPWRYGGRKR